MGVLVDGCAICNGIGETAPGQACPVCGGTGVATAEQAAQYRQLLVDAAVQAATERFRQAGTSAAEGVLRGLAQAREDAKETTARAGEVLSALLEVRRTALEIQAASLEIRSHPSAALFVEPLAPDPTDPPPGIVLPAGMGGEIYYLDSLLVRQLDVWGNLNVGGAGGLLANPMTTLGDLITGAALGAAQRLGVGTANQVLTVVGGVPAWANSAAGFANPMTTLGDIIIEGAGPAPARLGIGTAGQFLGISGGLPAWANPPSGFANPMTTKGDLIVADVGGAALRLPIGGPGQVLTVAGGTTAWQTNPAGFANPMTTSGDMIVATAGGAAVRLAAGLPSQVLAMAGGLPSWQPSPVIGIVPSGDSTGVTDAANIQAAITALPSGGLIRLGPGAFYVTPSTGSNCINLPAQTASGSTGANPVSIAGQGPATVLYLVGAAVTGIYYHRTAKFGTFPTFFAGSIFPAGFIRDMIIDGTNATGAAVGIDVGDGVGYDLRNLTIRNFNGVGGIGLNVLSRVATFYTEESNFGPIYLINCSTGANLGQGAGGPSHDYSTHEFHIAQAAGQDGVVVSGGANLGGCRLSIQGNVQTSASALTSAILHLTGGSSINYSSIEMRVETDQALGNAPASIIFATGTEQIFKCHGYLNPSGAGNPSLAGGEFSFNGPIVDSVLSTTWPTTTFPGLGTAWKNLGPNALVCVSGGTVTGISINGLATGLTTGAFFVPAGASLTVNGTVAPTVFNIVPAAWPQF